ncbi:hypothetical protein PHAVU_006G201900 [Phaseolus vulgaris]|uniref:Uncharacterized protein n=1 Tax=Phaseolus vulgaris TaxID=3885 RepID=V7BQT8_PHAVU|nr:hypothetical protein PHAVU_006G201900g [Phaseolus vulgaris]ESW20357.1 hypothetical protein PHAVU_006G201900g [Phaseolus vulgaris]
MENVYAELDDARAEVEKLKAECRLKAQLFEGLKQDRAQEFLKFQESRKRVEEQARELDLKSEEIDELKKVLEDLKSGLSEKETQVTRLISENTRIQASSADRLVELEESNRELVLALDELRVRNESLEQNACASSKEILSLRAFLLAAEKKCSEAEEKVQHGTLLKGRDGVILQLEEENIRMQDKIKWRNEQFKHLEEAHDKLQVEFRLCKEEWDKERSALLEEMSSLQVRLDSQTRSVERLQSRLEMCNHALAHEESKRKLLEAEISEFKTSFENVYSQCEEKKSEIQQLIILRNDEIAQLRNSLGEKEMVVRELDHKIVQLEQDNKELGDLLKEFREAQINNGGANSLTSKLRNKLRRLEDVHKSCASILKSKESQWGDQLKKMEADIVTYKSVLTNKEQEIWKLQMELENCYCTVEENRMGLLIFKSELVETYSKSFSADSEKASFGVKESENRILISTEQLKVKDNSLKSMAVQHSLLVEELEQYKKKLEESSEGELMLEQLMQMEYTLQYERSVAFEALERLEIEITCKSDEISRLDCEVQDWKSAAQTLKVSYEEIQGTSKEMKTSLESKMENERALKQANENLLCYVKDLEGKIEDLLLQIGLLERCSTDKMKEVERCKQEKEGLIQIVGDKECCIKDLQKEIAIAYLKQESTENEFKVAIHAQLEAEQTLKQEKEILLKIKEEKERTIEHFQELATTSEQDLLDVLSFSFSNQVENWVEVSLLRDALKNAEYLAMLEIEEKNTRIVKLEEAFFHLKQEAEQDLLDVLSFSLSNQVENWVEVSLLRDALKNGEYMVMLEIEEKNTRIVKLEEAFFHLKQEAEQLRASMEARKFENEKLMDKQQTMECVITELKFENGNLLQDIMKLSTNREDMLAHFEDILGKIGELSCGDMQLVEMLGIVLNTSEDENETTMRLVDCDKSHQSARDGTNGLHITPTLRKTEEIFDGRSPLREVNNLDHKRIL